MAEVGASGWCLLDWDCSLTLGPGQQIPSMRSACGRELKCNCARKVIHIQITYHSLYPGFSFSGLRGPRNWSTRTREMTDEILIDVKCFDAIELSKKIAVRFSVPHVICADSSF